MRQVLEELFDLLCQQKSLLESLLELSYEERRVLVSNEIDKLEEIVKLELRQLSKLGAIEKKRTALYPAISKEFGLNEGDISVSAIAARALPDEGEKIRKLQAELTDLLKQHSELNAENRELIKAHQDYSDAVLELMVDSEDPLNNFYSGDGRAAPERKKTTGFFDGHA